MNQTRQIGRPGASTLETAVRLTRFPQYTRLNDQPLARPDSKTHGYHLCHHMGLIVVFRRQRIAQHGNCSRRGSLNCLFDHPRIRLCSSTHRSPDPSNHSRTDTSLASSAKSTIKSMMETTQTRAECLIEVRSTAGERDCLRHCT